MIFVDIASGKRGASSDYVMTGKVCKIRSRSSKLLLPDACTSGDLPMDPNPAWTINLLFSHPHQIEAVRGILYRGWGSERYEVLMGLAVPVGWSVFFALCFFYGGKLERGIKLSSKKIVIVARKCREITRKYFKDLGNAQKHKNDVTSKI